MADIQITGKKISEFPLAESIDGTEQIPFVKNGTNGKVKILQITDGLLTEEQAVELYQPKGNYVTKEDLPNADEQALFSLAFYIDVNKPSLLGATRVDVGGNMGMRQMWENAAVSVLMDENGNYCELNREDCRYTAEGESLLNSDGTVVTEFAHGDFMKIIPVTYGRVQQVTVGTTTILRLWLSLVPLPGGYIIPQLVVGKFKASNVSGKMRSLPGMVPESGRTINGFFNAAQLRSNNHGLANFDFRNYLLFYMMSKYAYRDSQNCKGADGTLIWGVGLDGTESTSTSYKFDAQRYIKTGSTLSLGDYDGKAANVDSNSQIVHSVNVAGFENPWGQYFEMVHGLCSVGNDVYCWRSNFMPTGNPTADTFANVEKVILTCNAESGYLSGVKIITTDNWQGVYIIPDQKIAGISYGEYCKIDYNCNMWMSGGSAANGENCGLAYMYLNEQWTNSSIAHSARLAYYGQTNKVTANIFKQLA